LVVALPLIGYIALAAAAYCFFWAPRALLYLGVFFTPFTATSVINVGSSFGLTASLFFFATYIVAISLRTWPTGRIHITDSQVLALGTLVLFYICILVSLIPPIYTDSLQPVSLRMCLYVSTNLLITVAVALSLNTPGQVAMFLQVQIASYLLLSTWGIMQSVLAVAGIPYPSFIFNTSISDAAQLYGTGAAGGLARVASAAVEPSILVQSLMSYIAVAATVYVNTKQPLGAFGILCGLLCAVVLVLSFSSTGYFGMVMLVVLLTAQNPRRSVPLLVIVACLVVLVMLTSDHLSASLAESTLNKTQSWSFNKRFETVEAGFQAFLQAPLTGSGFASVTTYSLPVFLLGNLGIVGALGFVALMLILWIGTFRSHAFWSRFTLQNEGGLWANALVQGFRNALVVSLAMQSVAGFTYVFPDFWVLIGVMIALMKSSAKLGAPNSRTDPAAAITGRSFTG
jgi:O-Antigen ligase